MKEKIKRISGEVKDILYDKKITKLNLQLAKDELGTTIIVFENWTINKSKELFRLHIKEAIKLKAMIDNAIVDYFIYEKEN